MKIAMYMAIFLSALLILLGIMFWFTPWPILAKLIMFLLFVITGTAFISISIDILKNWD